MFASDESSNATRSRSGVDDADFERFYATTAAGGALSEGQVDPPGTVPADTVPDDFQPVDIQFDVQRREVSPNEVTRCRLSGPR